MNPRIRRNLWALALGLAAAGGTSGVARADAIPFGALGSITTPPGGVPDLVYFNGNSGMVTPPGNVTLGNFVVSTAASTINQTYTNDPVSLIIYSGTSGEQVTGLLNGSVGPGVANPSLAVTFTGVTPFGPTPLPFQVNLPLNTPLALATSGGGSTGTATALSVAITPVPEPASVAVFGAALGLGLWGLRRKGR